MSKNYASRSLQIHCHGFKYHFLICQLYWKSLWNIVDLVMVALCVTTLLYLMFGECSKARAREAVLDTLLLVVRNGIQFVRLVLMIRKYVRSSLFGLFGKGATRATILASCFLPLSSLDPLALLMTGTGGIYNHDQEI